ncbi:flavin monoamine oxidase family protein [Modestobacter sp. VKM Ac-2978]|uniref:flavin monoamine oxidase family protein n=1 Tax=Modestobacter sp. VKM Ac-2978 TaxID=3004132 RepID=UPI0022AA6F66|nr:FAD-dependent oxidoreductase [Modestobacter sp. VKM Ac-2978]MCZ2849893.1 FAD-dependent oxidoreductase [Modestobacter sp. VKM Ac-2978]
MDVVVIGVALSGLVAATQLRAAGLSLIVVEGRDRVGGRLDSATCADGRVLQRGSEFVAPGATEPRALAASFGIRLEPAPPQGAMIRLTPAGRVVEVSPFEQDAAAAAAYSGAYGALARLAEQVPAEHPWEAKVATDLDRQSLAGWLTANVANQAARELIERDFFTFGDPHGVSLLYVLWSAARAGGLDALHDLGDRFVGGTSWVVAALAGRLDAPLLLGRPVTRVEHDAGGVRVTHGGVTTRARALVVSMEPGQAGSIEFVPPLPPDRDQLQRQWRAAHGGKAFAVYDEPFWRREGLSGAAVLDGPFAVALDASTSDSKDGVLLAFYGDDGAAATELADLRARPDGVRQRVLDDLARAFGDAARRPREFHFFDWSGDAWSQGCGTTVPPGVLTTVGHTLRRPVGRIFWAGSENGAADWMEGAVTSGASVSSALADELGEK